MKNFYLLFVLLVFTLSSEALSKSDEGCTELAYNAEEGTRATEAVLDELQHAEVANHGHVITTARFFRFSLWRSRRAVENDAKDVGAVHRTFRRLPLGGKKLTVAAAAVLTTATIGGAAYLLRDISINSGDMKTFFIMLMGASGAHFGVDLIKKAVRAGGKIFDTQVEHIEAEADRLFWLGNLRARGIPNARALLGIDYVFDTFARTMTFLNRQQKASRDDVFQLERFYNDFEFAVKSLEEGNVEQAAKRISLIVKPIVLFYGATLAQALGGGHSGAAGTKQYLQERVWVSFGLRLQDAGLLKSPEEAKSLAASLEKAMKDVDSSDALNPNINRGINMYVNDVLLEVMRNPEIVGGL